MPRVYAGSVSWPPDHPAVALSIGNFDGVHAGHRAVLDHVKRLATSLSVQSCVLTFDPAPTAVVAPQRHQPRILSVADRVRRLGEQGIENIVIEPFTRAFAAHPARWFAQELLGRTLRARGVVVGYDFRFGVGREGDLRALQTWLPDAVIDEIRPYEEGGAVVSSSRVRKLVAAGEVAAAAVLLGRPHVLRGTVVHGDERGRLLGFPTANIENEIELLPAFGVYAVRASIDGGASREGVANVGIRPTFGGSAPRIELFLLDFTGDLYGRTLEVELVERIRGELRFESLDALKCQIAADVDAARGLLR